MTTRKPGRFIQAALFACIFVTALSAQTDWPMLGHDPGATRFSPLDQITPKNAAQLRLKWTYDVETQMPANAVPPAGFPPGAAGGRGAQAAPAGRASRRPRSRKVETVPLVIGDRMFISTPYNRVVALDADTGRNIWEYESAHTPAMRGVAYWPGDGALPPQVVFGTSDGFLISLNANTGKPVPGFGDEGIVDLRKGIGFDTFPNRRYGMSSPPAIYRNLAITGSSPGEMPARGPAGDIRAWDMHNGKLAWTFHTIPQPGETNHDAWKNGQWENRAGANSWGITTVDTERGMLFVPIGTPNTDFYGGDRQGSNLYGSTLVALDAGTGKVRWYFQTTHHDNWDYDLTAAPVLMMVKHDGKTIPAVAQITKQGAAFHLRSRDGDADLWREGNADHGG